MPGWQDFTSFSQQFLSSDLLLSDLTGILNTSLTYLPVIEHGITALSVSVEVHLAATITVTVTDATGIVPAWSQQQVAGAALQTLQFVSPYSYTTASALKVIVTSSVNQVANSPTFIIGYGAPLSGQQGVQLVRPDGREYPVGQHATFNAANAVSVTVIPAPGAGIHILLASATYGQTSTAGSLNATINGAASVLAASAVAATYPVGLPAGGLLLDANTPLTIIGTAGSGASVAVIYDLVT
jgi:hypothetical protein